MTYTPLATQISPSAQHSARTAGPVNMIILHHGATTSADQIVSMMVSESREVSAHCVVKDDRIIAVVPEEQRAWSLADAYWDSRAFTVETANESTNGWTISAASHESLARLAADWAKRYGFPIIRSGNVPAEQWTLIGHREVNSIHGGSYSTACPGGMNLDWIAARANQILNEGGVTPTPPKPKEIKVQSYHVEDYTARNGGRSLNKGDSFYLNSNKGAATSSATSLVGVVGRYTITPHIYIEGTPGDTVDITLVWQDTKANPPANSNHYSERVEVGADGTAKRSVTFERDVNTGYAVYARVTAGATNKGIVKVTVLDADATAYTVA